ncbi:MAG TPA: rhomboid family intramembrane serine protease [Rhodanobacteraceae bacterium]|nr:rhomboid family intramembrane serine protease [Rhodanobacteraceae bacterium]
MRFNLPPVTLTLLIANVAIFLLMMAGGNEWLIAHAALWPLGPERLAGYAADGTPFMVGFHVWQLLTYAFLHGGWAHIGFNMLALYMFGGPVESLFGARHFLFYYLFCAVIAALAHLAVVHFFTGGFYPTLGASGAIFGLLLAFGMLYPHAKIIVLILPIPMPAWLAVIGYMLLELFLGITGTQAGVAHFAHLGGALGGFALLQYWRGKLPIKPRWTLFR